MQLYWKCEVCDESNAYPNVKVCETCGTPMTAKAEARVLSEKDELERKARELELAREAEERRRQAEERERQRREKLAAKLKALEAREKKLSSFLRKTSAFFNIAFKVLAAAAVVVAVVICINNADDLDFKNSFDIVADNVVLEFETHTEEGLFSDKQKEKDIFAQASSAFEISSSNVINQIEYIKAVYDPGQNIEDLFEDIVEFLSGDVKK